MRRCPKSKRQAIHITYYTVLPNQFICVHSKLIIMSKMDKQKTILALGIILLFVGLGIVMSALPSIPLASFVEVSTPVGTVKAEGLTQEDVTTIAIGSIVALFGLTLIVFNKKI